MKVAHLLLSLLLLAPPAAGQVYGVPRPQAPATTGPPQPPGTVAGKVTNAVTGQPVKRAAVTLSGGQGVYAAVTGDSGEFLLEGVQPASSYFVNVQSAGYANIVAGSALRPIAVGPGEAVKDVALQLTPLSVISGKVLNDEGEPLQGAMVQAQSYQYQNGFKRLLAAGSSTTDDRGQYRIFDLQPGHYYLSATLSAPFASAQGPHVHSTIPEEGYAKSYLPGVGSVVQASQIDVQPGSELNGADFRLRKVPVYHIRGAVIDAQSRQPFRGGVFLQECENGDSNGMGPQTGSVSVQPNGNFDIRQVVPGSYCLVVQQGPLGLYARQLVMVKDEDVNGVTVSATAGFEIKGSVLIEGTPPANTPRVAIRLDPVDGITPVPSSQPGKTGLTFTIQNVHAGVYVVMVQGVPQQFYVKSMQYGNQDVSGTIRVGEAAGEMAITLGTDPGTVSGSVQSSSGAPANGGVIMIAPAGALTERRDLLRPFGTGPDGSFQAGGLAPGDYKIFALEMPRFNELQNPELRKLLEDRAASVTVHAGGRETVQIRAISADEFAAAINRLQ